MHIFLRIASLGTALVGNTVIYNLEIYSSAETNCKFSSLEG